MAKSERRSSGAGVALGATVLGAAGGAAAGGLPAGARERKVWKDSLERAKKNPLMNVLLEHGLDKKKAKDVMRKAVRTKIRGPAARGAAVGGLLGASFGVGYMAKRAAAHKLQGRMKFQGLDISIENAKGSVRKWTDPHGKEVGSTKMHFAYGYIRKTEGTDGDHVDVYVGPNSEAKMAYIVDQNKKPPGDIKKDGKAWTQFDEQKVMLGFPSAASAKAAYMKQYDDPRFFRSLRAMTMEDFSKKVLAKENHGEKIAVSTAWVKRMVRAGVAKSSPQRTTRFIERQTKAMGETTKGFDTGKLVVNPSLGKRTTAISTALTSPMPKVSEFLTLDRSKEAMTLDTIKKVVARSGRSRKELQQAGSRIMRGIKPLIDQGHSLSGARIKKRLAVAAEMNRGAINKSAEFLDNPNDPFHTPPTQRHSFPPKYQKRKKANGDMIEYFRNNPQKYKEYLERQEKKKAKMKKSSSFDPIAFADLQGTKLAQEYWDGRTEMEKVAIIGSLLRGVGKVVGGGAKVVAKTRGATKAVSNVAKKEMSGIAFRNKLRVSALRGKGQAIATNVRALPAKAESSYLQGRYNMSPAASKVVQAEKAGIRASDRSRAQVEKAMTPTRGPDPRLAPPSNSSLKIAPAKTTQVPSQTPLAKGPYRTAATPTSVDAVATKGRPMAASFTPKVKALRRQRAQLRIKNMTPQVQGRIGKGIAPATPSSGKLITPGRVLGAAAVGGTGVALYGGVKAIEAATNLTARGANPNPYIAARVPGIGRPY